MTFTCRWIWPLVMMCFFTACGDVQEQKPKMTSEAIAVELMQASLAGYSPEQVATAFALNSEFTDIQRDALRKDLVGKVVEWSFRIYEISHEGTKYHVTSQVLPVSGSDAIPLLRIVAKIEGVDEAGAQQLIKMKTNDVIKVRGQVRDILLRTMMTIEPAILISK